MNRHYPKLFQKGRIGRLALPNRIVRTSMGTYLGNPDCSVSERQIKSYEEAAEGGAGLIFMDNAMVVHERHMGVSAASDAHIPGLSQLAGAIADRGAKSGIQIVHPGRDGGFVGGEGVKAASRIQAEGWYQHGFAIPFELSVEEIHGLVAAFGDAARRAMIAGFDLIEIQAACGTLLTNFLSPGQNRRGDMYGGSLHNRMRFLVEAARDVRRKIGPHCPLGVRMSMIEYEQGGIGLEESIEVCKALEQEGVDVINVIGGTHAEAIHAAPSMMQPMALNVPAAAALKREIGIPVIVGGSIHTPGIAEEILENGDADFVGAGRPFLADGAWPKKAKEGRPEDIRPCIRCNDGCHDRSLLPGRVIECTVNPALFKPDSLPVTKAEKPKKIAVVGGGPAGMEAARVCALRGHDVTLYERRELGGTLKEASFPDFKADIRRLIDYYKAQIKKLDVKVVDKEAGADDIKNGAYDAVFVATGAALRKFDIQGIDNPMVTDALEVFGGGAQLGQRAVVIGGGATGAEIAIYLGEQGKEVTIVEMLDEILPSVLMDKPAYFERLFGAKVRIMTGQRLDAVRDGTAVIVDRFGRKQEIPADSIVLASGFASRSDLWRQLEAETDIEVYALGDCARPRMIFDAIHEGFLAARRV
ncbi:MAG: FAD-dependent oxidoreductase [Clostridiales Family XIII bacterium]|nr:FAD-dependent oxidoreductase [Clostridiales Family XIII bacterium]